MATFFLRVYPIGLALPSGFVPRVLFVRYVINFYFSLQSRPNVPLRDVRLREGLYSKRAFAVLPSIISVAFTELYKHYLQIAVRHKANV